MPIAAIDFGRRWVGIALADDAGLGVYPVATIERRSLKRDLEAIGRCLATREVTRVIVGLPLNMDGSAGPLARAAEAFARALGAATGIATEMFDERLTSFEAEERLRELPRRKRGQHAVDAVAACVILEGWLQSRGTQGARGPLT
jgi:putative Holliday junction resolvase